MKNTIALKSSLTDNFVDIVSMIQNLIELRSSNFTSMLEINNFIEHEASLFMKDSSGIINEISGSLGKKINDIDINGMKFDIDESTETFIKITDDLEILSYNTICRTMSLGVKGSTIAHISKEIKSNAEVAKDLLSSVSEIFTQIYNEFNKINSSFLEKREHVDDMAHNSSSEVEQLEISSDLSMLIEYSQFHDIIIQEIDTILNALESIKPDSDFNRGKYAATMELGLNKIISIKSETEDIFNKIKNVIGEFMYNVNTDIQNMVSRANIVKMDFFQAKDYSEEIETMIIQLLEMIKNAEKIIKNARNGIKLLSKFGKGFRNLLVITSIEVARIGDENLGSVVTSMTNTEKILNNLVSKLINSLEMWSVLKSDFFSVLQMAGKDMEKLSSMHSVTKLNSVLEKAEDLDKELNKFRSMFNGDECMDKIEKATNDANNLFEHFINDISKELDLFINKIPDSVKNSPEFSSGYASADIKEIKADRSEHSSIDFF